MIPTKVELEARVLQIARLLSTGNWSEDDLVEFKKAWPEDDGLHGWARRLAGHCNAALGTPVLWLVGLHERDGVSGCNHRNRADWLPKLQSCFDDRFAPSLLHDINVPVGNASVTALLFESDRAPYVVKVQGHGIPGGGPTSMEVPWREGTSVRTARRQDLIRMLHGQKRPARIELLQASIHAFPISDRPGWIVLELRVIAYVSPQPATRYVWPFHWCGIRLIGPDAFGDFWTTATIVDAGVSPNHAFLGGESPYPLQMWRKSKSLYITDHEAVLDGPCAIQITANVACEAKDVPDTALEICCAMIDAEDGTPSRLSVRLDPIDDKPSCFGEWKYHPHRDATVHSKDRALERALGFGADAGDMPQSR